VSNVALGPESVSADVPVPLEPDAPVLAMPDGWVIDDLARERLARQLTRAPRHFEGVVAESGPLPCGASYRVHAERLCLRPLSDAAETSRDELEGAVLLRPGVAFETRDGGVQVQPGTLLVDPGAHVHDPWRPPGPIEAASRLGRLPFPRRPVVVFLACEPDVEVLDWARSLVNNLVRRDVEGRLAMLEISEGLHLTQPCLPSEESIRTLKPDVIVALDQTALERAPVWCRTDRSVVLVEFTPDVAVTAELVSWQLERARGRLRARIGRQINAPTLVSLVNRLCAGPHSAPPDDAPPTGAAVATVRALLTSRPAPTTRPVETRSVLVVTGNGGAATRHELNGLVDHLVAAGHGAQISPVGSCKAGALRAADIVVVGSPVNEPDFAELVEARRLDGRPTIAGVEAREVLADSWSPGAVPKLESAPERLTASAGGVMTGSTAVYALLRRLGLRAHLLPPLLTRAYAAELRSARRGHNRFSDPVIGWHVGTAGALPPDYAAAVADAALEILGERPELRVEIVGQPSHLPEPLLAHPRVSMLRDGARQDALSRWAVHLWTPPVLADGIADDTASLVEVSAVGVPTVLPQPVQDAIGGYPPPGLLVDPFRRADDWSVPLRLLLDNEASWSRHSRAAMRRFDTMHGAPASAAAVNRFLGWAYYKDGQR